MSKRTQMRKHTPPRSIKPVLFWVATLIGFVAMTAFCIGLYQQTGSAAEGSSPDMAVSQGPFYLIMVLILGCVLVVGMLILDTRQYLHNGKAKRR